MKIAELDLAFDQPGLFSSRSMWPVRSMGQRLKRAGQSSHKVLCAAHFHAPKGGPVRAMTLV
jgi:hypothetical protein